MPLTKIISLASPGWWYWVVFVPELGWRGAKFSGEWSLLPMVYDTITIQFGHGRPTELEAVQSMADTLT